MKWFYKNFVRGLYDNVLEFRIILKYVISNFYSFITNIALLNFNMQKY